jgi:hypothetical protein
MKRVFFIFSIGRSGSKFIAELLNKDKRGVVLHHPDPFDKHLIALSYSGEFSNVCNSFLEQRFNKLMKKYHDRLFYGEYNPYLRFSTDWLKKKFDPPMMHIVRDGRDFVRSVYIRYLFTPKEISMPLLPKNQEIISRNWFELDRFEQLCWYWKYTNDYLHDKINNYVKLEDLLTDYNHFRNKLTNPLEIEIPFNVWKRFVTRPINTSKGYMLKRTVKRLFFPWRKNISINPIEHWSKWDDSKSEKFWSICGETMNKFNYR